MRQWFESKAGAEIDRGLVIRGSPEKASSKRIASLGALLTIILLLSNIGGQTTKAYHRIEN